MQIDPHHYLSLSGGYFLFQLPSGKECSDFILDQEIYLVGPMLLEALRSCTHAAVGLEKVYAVDDEVNWQTIMAVRLHHKNKAQNLNETHLLLYPIDIGFQASISKEKLKSSILFTLKFCFWSMQLVDFNVMYFKIVNAIACSNQWSNFIQLLGIWLNTRVRYLPSCNEDIL